MIKLGFLRSRARADVVTIKAIASVPGALTASLLLVIFDDSQMYLLTGPLVAMTAIGSYATTLSYLLEDRKSMVAIVYCVWFGACAIVYMIWDVSLELVLTALLY